MVSFPVGITGSLSNPNITARLIASSLKGSQVGMQQSGTSTLGLLQVAGSHPSSSLFSPGGTIQRANVGTKGNGTASHAQPPSITPPTSGTTPPPTGIAMGPALVTLSTQQQLQLAIQQQNQQMASIQLQHLRHTGGGNISQPNKGKGRKRGGTTPPK